MKRKGIMILSGIFIITLFYSCASFEVQSIDEREITQLEHFELKPMYLLSFDRITVLRKQGVSYADGKNYYSQNDTTEYDELVCSLGNNLFIDAKGNIFFEVSDLLNIENKDYSIESKKWKYRQVDDIIEISDDNTFTKDRKFKIEEEGVLEEFNGKYRKFIEATSDGYMLNLYSAFGTLSLNSFIRKESDNSIRLVESEISNVFVKKINDKQISITDKGNLKYGITLVDKNIKLSITKENTIQMDVSFGFTPTSYEIIYSKNRIIVKEYKGNDLMQLDINEGEITINRVIIGSSIFNKIFKNDRETLKFVLNEI